MVSFDDDDENGSNASEEDNDAEMEDVDEGEGDADPNDEDEGDEEGENEEDEGEGDEDSDDQEEAESPSRRAVQDRMSRRSSPKPLTNGSATHSRHASGGGNILSPSPRPSVNGLPFRPGIRAEAVTASTYDIVPTIAAPQSTSINCVTATPDMRWVFTGGTDGYIRKYNWPDSANGKLMLTVAQRHPFVDSVTKAGMLLSYWENEESAVDTPTRQHSYDEPVSLSPVYSLAVQNQGLWLLSGTEFGGINLMSVRHAEGTRITTLRKHTSAVSVLYLAPDEKSVLSGSWDKSIQDWDLNTGQVKRSFMGSGSQISAIQPRPISSLPVPELLGASITNGTFSSSNSKPTTNGDLANGGESASSSTLQNDEGLQDAPGDDDDMNSLFGDDGDIGGLEPPMQLGDVEDDEFSRAIAEGVQPDEHEDAANDIDLVDTDAGGPVQPPDETEPSTTLPDTEPATQPTTTEQPTQPSPNPRSTLEDAPATATEAQPAPEESPQSETTFLDACIDGTIRVWDRRQAQPVARITPPRGTPPWCMSACWSPDGNYIYAGRRNNCVEEFSLHKGLREPSRTFRFPAGSGPVSAVRSMPNGRHMICASHDILRLYDLQAAPQSRHSPVPFLIIPGHRTGIISSLYVDPTCTFLISTAGNRGWEGGNIVEALLGYEIGVVK